MGRINLKGVIVGGLVAGLILNVVDYVLWGMIFAKDFEASLQALGRPPAAPLIPLFVVLDFLYGIVLVYLYAAIRPRYGPGAKTAIAAGVIVWVLVGLLHTLGEAPLGFFPGRLYVISTIVALIVLPIAAVAGARLYSEPA
jgi:hypothetical protein